MAAVKGSLLVTAEGMEISRIPVEKRKNSVVGFYEMKQEAERHHDRFYALQEVYNHTYSYGSFYPNFYNMSWDVFKKIPSLDGIDEIAFQLMQSFCQNPGIATLDNEKAFREKEEPQALTGYGNKLNTEVFVGCKVEWEEWHRKWYTAHPQDIDWNGYTNEWLPRQDLIMAILKRELRVKFVEDGLEHERAKQKVDAIAESQLIHEFHEQVMKHKGDALEAYASQIGGEICRCNYYTFEKDLSSMEQQNADSLRKIYSIINRHGRIQFISIDFKHGMFEFLNENGDHLGEYRFDGSPNKGVEVDHGLQCLEQWRKQTGR